MTPLTPAAEPLNPEEPLSPGTEIETGASLDALERSLAAVLQLLADRETLGDIARRSGHQLAPASWALLEYLESIGELRISDIAACHGVDVSTVTPRIKSLGKAGLVSRRTLESDARVGLIEITAKGRLALESIHSARRELIGEALAGIEPSRVADTSTVLNRIAGHLSPVARRLEAERRAGHTG